MSKRVQNMNTPLPNKILLYGSIITFLYSSFLIVISIIDLNNSIIRAFGELPTIPFILLLILITILSLATLIKEKFNIRSMAFKATILSISTIILLIVATILE